jgi:hypothetical protein
MKYLVKRAFLPVAAVALAAMAAGCGMGTNKVDGSATTAGVTCSWTNANTSDNPPNTSAVDHTSVHMTCSDDTVLTLQNDPIVSFDDTAGTATVDIIDVTGTKAGITCEYRATNVGLTRSGSTRAYSGGPFTATKVSGNFLCPNTATFDTATITFH